MSTCGKVGGGRLQISIPDVTGVGIPYFQQNQTKIGPIREYCRAQSKPELIFKGVQTWLRSKKRTHSSSLKKTQVVRAQQQEKNKMKKRSPLTSPTHSKADTEYKSSQFSPSDSESSKPENSRLSKCSQGATLKIIQTVNIRFGRK